MADAKSKKIAGMIGFTLIKAIIAVVMFLPIIWILTGGFKTVAEFTTSGSVLPQNPTLENFQYIFYHSNILGYTRNTVILMLGTTIGTLLSSALVAYPLARMEFRGKKLVFSIIVATMLIPNIALIIPQYIMFVTIGVLSCVFWWNELTQPVFYINSDTWRTLTIALMTSFMYTTSNTFVISWPTIMAAATLMILPPMLLYLFGSKYLIGGIKTGGLKG